MIEPDFSKWSREDLEAELRLCFSLIRDREAEIRDLRLELGDAQQMLALALSHE